SQSICHALPQLYHHHGSEEKRGASGSLPWHNTIIMVCVFSLPLIYRSISAQLVLIHCSLLFLGVTPKYHAAAKSAFRFLRVYVAAEMSSISMVVPSGVSVSGPSQYLILSKRWCDCLGIAAMQLSHQSQNFCADDCLSSLSCAYEGRSAVLAAVPSPHALVIFGLIGAIMKPRSDRYLLSISSTAALSLSSLIDKSSITSATPYGIIILWIIKQRRALVVRFFICNHLILFQLAHIHIATPAISNMTAIIVSPPVAVYPQRYSL
ncbi:hypothetical protein, partial [Lacticaseibacillus casei]